jgi:hypothetical protein
VVGYAPAQREPSRPAKPRTTVASASPARCPDRDSRSVYVDPDDAPGAAAGVLLDAAAAKGEEARDREQALADTLDLPARDAEQRVRRAQRGAERDELLAGLERTKAR